MTFSEQIVYGLTSPSKYKELIKLKTSRFVLFAVVMSLILGVLTFVIPAGAKISGFGGFKNLFEKRIGNMEYSDEKLSISESFEMSVDGANIIIDTSNPTVTNDMLKKDGAYFAFGSETLRMSIVYNHSISDYQIFDLKYLLPDGFTNETLTGLIPYIYVYMIVMFIVSSVGFFIKYGFFALVLSLMINSVNKQLSLGMSRGQVFQLCFYGESLGMLISNFNKAVGFIYPDIVSIITVFMSMNFITKAVVYMNPRNHV